MAAATTAKAKVFSGLHGAGCWAEERAGCESDPAQSLFGQAGQRPWSTLVGAPGQSSRQGRSGVSPVSAGEPAPQMQHHCRGPAGPCQRSQQGRHTQERLSHRPDVPRPDPTPRPQPGPGMLRGAHMAPARSAGVALVPLCDSSFLWEARPVSEQEVGAGGGEGSGGDKGSGGAVSGALVGAVNSQLPVNQTRTALCT